MSPLLAAHVRGTKYWVESTDGPLKGVIKGWVFDEKGAMESYPSQM